VRCIFVLDILNGAVVHALRGERRSYRPIAEFSRIVSTSEPLAMLRTLSPGEVYVADLDRLTGRGDSLDLIGRISGMAKTMADIGVSRASDLDLFPPAASPVLGTETASLSLIKEASARADSGGRRAVVSIDMRGEKLLAADPALVELKALDLLEILNPLNIEAVILLDLSRVGAEAGLDATFLQAAAEASKHPLILGGGIRGEDDLAALEDLGFDGALVATAVHNGRIPPSRIQ
jgi:phosphoribosylformimino-5-aminoimidazole carboxamide ribotide isomerase